jgi:hypothetical protein
MVTTRGRFIDGVCQGSAAGLGMGGQHSQPAD